MAGTLEGVTACILEREPDISREIHPQALSRVLRWARARPPELADSRRVKFCVREPPECHRERAVGLTH